MAGLVGVAEEEMPGLRTDRLFVGVLRERDAGKSRTWEALFKKRVNTSKKPRRLELRRGEFIEVFVVSGSF